MLTYKGGQKARKGMYWDVRNGRRIDFVREGMLPGGDASTYLRVPPVALPLFGPIVGLLYVVLFPFIGVAVVLTAAGRRVAESIVSLTAQNLSFHWRPKNAYLTGKKKKQTNEKSARK